MKSSVPSPQEMSVFEIQAYMDLTKHIGSLQATDELARLCQIGPGKYVLDVGCGVGATPAYLARQYRCRVVGVDISPAMIARAQERAAREGVADRVELRVADAQALPFADGVFDVAMTESVLAFVADKQKALRELVRVTKPGGYVGLNESTLIKPAPAHVRENLSRAAFGGGDFPLEGWATLLREAGLSDIVVRERRVEAGSEGVQMIRRYGCLHFARSLWRLLVLYVQSPAYRAFAKMAATTPKELAEYLGYGIYVGRK